MNSDTNGNMQKVKDNLLSLRLPTLDDLPNPDSFNFENIFIASEERLNLLKDIITLTDFNLKLHLTNFSEDMLIEKLTAMYLGLSFIKQSECSFINGDMEIQQQIPIWLKITNTVKEYKQRFDLLRMEIADNNFVNSILQYVKSDSFKKSLNEKIIKYGQFHRLNRNVRHLENRNPICFEYSPLKVVPRTSAGSQVNNESNLPVSSEKVKELVTDWTNVVDKSELPKRTDLQVASEELNRTIPLLNESSNSVCQFYFAHGSFRQSFEQVIRNAARGRSNHFPK